MQDQGGDYAPLGINVSILLFILLGDETNNQDLVLRTQVPWCIRTTHWRSSNVHGLIYHLGNHATMKTLIQYVRGLWNF